MDDPAIQGDDSTPVSTATDEPTNPETVVEDAPAGDVGSDENVSEDTGDDTPAEGDEPEADEKPASRSGERIRELARRNKELETKLDEVLEKVDSLQTPAPKQEPEDDIDLSVYDPKELERTKKLLSKLGLGSLEKDVAELHSVLKARQEEEAIQKELSKKQAAIDKFKDVITAEEFDANLKKMLKSKDPEVVARANHLPYEDLIRQMKSKEIIEREVNAALKAKKKAGPKVDAGSGGLPQPEKKAIEWDNNDPIGSMRAIEQSVLRAAAASE